MNIWHSGRVALLATLLLAGCSLHRPASETVIPKAVIPEKTEPPKTIPEKPLPVTARYLDSQWADLPGWPGEQLATSWQAWLTSCQRLARRPEWQPLCLEARQLDAADTAAQQTFFERRFRPWRIATSTGADSGLITGYYEALLTGGLNAAPGRVPLYGVPDDLLVLDIASLYPDLKGQRLRGRLDGRTVKPYWSRGEIADGVAGLDRKVLAWADNAIDAFFLEVQGSARIQLEDGRLLRLGYADQNGHPYKSIGRWLVDQGELTLDQASMQSIRTWAENNPQRLQEMLNANPSFVFFRVMENAEGGAIGALNLPLTDGASIAVDPKFIPLGSPVYLTTTRPDNQQPLTRLMHAQDTGGAIRGPVRADFFWGFGHDAGALAGRMKQEGQLWLLWPASLPLPEGK